MCKLSLIHPYIASIRSTCTESRDLPAVNCGCQIRKIQLKTTGFKKKSSFLECFCGFDGHSKYKASIRASLKRTFMYMFMYIHYVFQQHQQVFMFIHYVFQQQDQVFMYIHYVFQQQQQVFMYIHYVFQQQHQVFMYIHYVFQQQHQNV